MRQVFITRTGGPEVLEVREAPTPDPAAGEVRIRVEAAGINFADLLTRRGLYPDAPKLPAVVGYEVGGTVEAVGRDVAAVAQGDAVLAMTRFGGYSSHVIAREEQVFERPSGMSAAVGAAVPVNYLTAFQAMVVMGGLRRAEELGGRRMRVLVHGASGGVGTAAADLGRIYGAELFGTASPGKHGYVRERGYAHALDYHRDDWVDELMALTGGRGVDLVLDPIGGRSWAQSFAVLAPTGRVVLFGFSAAMGRSKLDLLKAALAIPWRKFLPFALISANEGALGVNVGHLWHVGDEVARWAHRLLDYYRQGEIRPHVDRTFPLEEASAAHAYIEERRNRGKVVLIP